MSTESIVYSFSVVQSNSLLFILILYTIYSVYSNATLYALGAGHVAIYSKTSTDSWKPNKLYQYLAQTFSRVSFVIKFVTSVKWVIEAGHFSK